MGKEIRKDSDKMEYIFLRTSQQLSSYKSNSRIEQQEPWDCALVWRDKLMEAQIKMDCGKDRWVDRGERQWPWWAKLVHHVYIKCPTMLMATVAFRMQSIWKQDHSLDMVYLKKSPLLSQHHGQLSEMALSHLLPRWMNLYLSHFSLSHISQ